MLPPSSAGPGWSERIKISCHQKVHVMSSGTDTKLPPSCPTNRLASRDSPPRSYRGQASLELRNPLIRHHPDRYQTNFSSPMAPHSSTQHEMETLHSAAQYIITRLPGPGLPRPKVAIVCGSGLGGIANHLDAAKPVTQIPYADIPGFPEPTVVGHAGRMVCGYLAGTESPVLLFVGRVQSVFPFAFSPLFIFPSHSPSIYQRGRERASRGGRLQIRVSWEEANMVSTKSQFL